VLLVEHKSEGQDLDRACSQASDYFDALPDRDLPRYILVSDFARFRLYDLEADKVIDFRLGDLHKEVRHFGFIAGYRVQEIRPQDPVNIKAAEQMGRLHDLLKASGYAGTHSNCCWCGCCSASLPTTRAFSSRRSRSGHGSMHVRHKTARIWGLNSPNSFRY